MSEVTARDDTWPAIDDSFIDQQTATLNFQLGRPSALWVAPDGSQVIFTRSGPRSFAGDLYRFDVATGREELLLAADDLLGGEAEVVSAAEKARRERMRQAARGIAAFSASDDGARLLVPLGPRLFLFEPGRGRGTRRGRGARELRLARGGPPVDPRLSPDGRRVAMVRDGDLHVLDVSRGASRRLTRRRSSDVEHGLAEFVAQEELHRMRGHWWSPDGKLLAYQRSDASEVETLYIADATRPDQPPAAMRYPRPGTANVSVDLGVVAAAGGRTAWVKWDRRRFPYLASVTWPTKGPLTAVVLSRAQTELAVLAIEPRSGAARELHREEDPAWLNLDPAMPAWLPDASGFLWTTERGGAWQLELRDARGRLVRELTGPEDGLHAFAGFDWPRRAAWVLLCDDPRRLRVARVPLAGGAMEPVAAADGDALVVASSRGGAHVLITSGRGGAPRFEVVRDDGSPSGELSSMAETPRGDPNLELCRVEVDGRLHHAAVVRPRGADRSRRYPVLLDVYGGPHVTVVHADPRVYLLDQVYADAGFVVVRADGRGTPRRGRAWERAIHRDLASVPLADQVAVLRAVAAGRPEMRMDQVGVFGWSFGGYLAALAALQRPDVFRAAVAGAPVTDWLDYDTAYTERYMGLPADNPDGYRATSALTHAARLSRPLLLIHGTTDDNVHFTHTLKLGEALFRAGRPFELLPLPGHTHMVPDPTAKKALVGRIVEFFRRHLAPPA